MRQQSAERRDLTRHADDAPQFAALGREAISLGQPGIAIDTLSEGLAAFPGNQELLYLSALALANAGSSRRAAQILGRLLSEEKSDPAIRSDILSLAGRVAKDRWSKLPEGGEKTAMGDQARRYYRQAFEMSRALFPGINAATISVLNGHEADGLAIAREVLSLGLLRSRDAADKDPWLFATLGEACLLLGNLDEAAGWYRRATASTERRYGDIASMRRQIKLLAPRLDGVDRILGILDVPVVAVLTGHMIDSSDRQQPRFPPHVAPAVGASIANLLADANIGFGYCSAACGADILFIEQAVALGMEVNVVLPFEREDFIQTSVAFGGSSWIERFERALSHAASVTYCVRENYLGDDVLFAFATELTCGMATLRAAQLETEVTMLAVADLGSEIITGGTLSNIRRWQKLGRDARILDLREIRAETPNRERAGPGAGGAGRKARLRPPSRNPGLPWGQRQIKTMLFADIIGFSRLREHDTPQFFSCFLGAIQREIEASNPGPVFGNTWGDGLYLVFDSAPGCADFALRLRDAIARIEWQSFGLPRDLNVRIGMHTGPVFKTLDPIIKSENFFGSHVTRAARIEPVAAPGTVYVSEQTAASLSASGDLRFSCDYLGPLSLAKDYGALAIYRLRRVTDAE